MKILEVIGSFKPGDISIVMPYIIAEIGVNHEGNYDLAKRLIEEAKEGGANAVKFQSYKASTLAVKDSPYYWDLKKESTLSQFDLFSKYDKFWKKEFEKLKEFSDKTGIEFLSTPFDVESAKFLNELMDVFKVSSSDITNKPFIELLCDFNKPIILSTGASYLYEIQEAVSWIENKGNELVLLHCILNYPTQDKDANLGMILDLRKRFTDNLIGYSDHTLPNEMKILEIATLFGAKIIEKHFTHDKSLPGNDHYHAMDKNDLRKFRTNFEELIAMVGSCKINSLKTEEMARSNARRSLVSKRHVPSGQKIELEDVTWKRPASGIGPKFVENVLGKKASMDIKKDTILKWHHLKD